MLSSFWGLARTDFAYFSRCFENHDSTVIVSAANLPELVIREKSDSKLAFRFRFTSVCNCIGGHGSHGDENVGRLVRSSLSGFLSLI